MTVERVRVGDVLSLQRRSVDIEPFTEYSLIGVYSFGKGIFHREPRRGSELGDYRFFSIAPGDLVLSNIQAWEGAIACAQERDAGTIGTHRFLTYVSRDGQVDTAWAKWFFLSEPGMELIRKAAPGTTIRNRTLAIDRFEALEIPLPPIDEQRQVASQLDRLSEVVQLASERRRHGETLFRALTDSRESKLIAGLGKTGVPARRLADVAEINPRPTRLAADTLVAFVPMAAVDADTGSVSDAEVRSVAELGAGYKQFRRGDVIFARITPCMQNGKSAVFSDRDYGLGSTEFHVVRPGNEVSVEYIHRILRTRAVRLNATEHFTGTAGQQRVPADFLRELLVPIPSREDQQEIVASLDALRASAGEFRALNQKASALARSLLPASLNATFTRLT
ncbi:restriction endonuclease S [Mycobacterium avium subsp. silvaticum ATCC 49884]|uniref:restriction endonuclease subunit S n=1 Tax=Mycobacterium avium TaxID=1764 RepID=UPI0003D1E8F6|nr:restriction endonuclease S [Mycobacterium avium subsp. silvaticum ATCC 49884]